MQMENSPEVNTVNYFKSLFSSAEKRFKSLDTATKVRVSTLVGLSGFARKSAEDNLLPEILAQLKNDPPRSTKRKITTELALAAISSSNIEKSMDYFRVWGLEEKMLKEMTSLLIISESPNGRDGVAEAGYSSDPVAAKSQVLRVISKALSAANDSIPFEALNTPGFNQAWEIFTSSFVGGTFAGMARIDQEKKLNAISGQIGCLESRSKSILDEISRELSKEKESRERKEAEAKREKQNRSRRRPNDREAAFLALSSSILGSQVKPFADASSKSLLQPFMDREICGYLYGYIQLTIGEFNLADASTDDSFFTLTEHCIRDVVGDHIGGLAYDIAVACCRGKEPDDFINGKKLAASDFEDVKHGRSRPNQLSELICRSIFVTDFLDATKLFGETESIQERASAAKVRFEKIDSPFLAAMDYAADWVSRISSSIPPNEMGAAGGPIFRVVGGICELVIDKKADYADGKRYFESVVGHLKAPIPEGMGEVEKVRNFDEMLERNQKALQIVRMTEHIKKEMVSQMISSQRHK